MPCCLSRWSQPSQNTCTVPVLSVRMVQPLCPLTRENLPEEEPGIFTSVSLDQLSPPSVERATSRVWALEPALGPPTEGAKRAAAWGEKRRGGGGAGQMRVVA